MAKKNVIIFDGEDKFINKKKHVYSKEKGISAYVNAVATEEEGVASNELKRQIVSSAQSVEPTPQTTSSVVTETIAPQGIKTGLLKPLPSVSTPTPEEVVSNVGGVLREIVGGGTSRTPVGEPSGSIFTPPSSTPSTIIMPTPNYSIPSSKFDDRLPNDGIPEGRTPITEIGEKRINPIFTAPVPPLPPPDKPKDTIILPTPILVDSGVKDIKGQPIMVAPEVPKPKCPAGFMLDPISGQCIQKGAPENVVEPIDPCATPPSSPILLPNQKWVKSGVCSWKIETIKNEEPPITPTTSTTTTTTTKKSGDSTSTTTTTTTKKGVADIEIDNFGTAPSYGGGVGGGGGGAFPDEQPLVAPKKNYFWYYVAAGVLGYYLYKKFKK